MNIKDDRQLDLDLSGNTQPVKDKSSVSLSGRIIYVIEDRKSVVSLEDKRNQRLRSDRVNYVSDILKLVKHFT